MGDSLLTSIVFFTTTNKVLTMNFSCKILILIERKNLCQHIHKIVCRLSLGTLFSFLPRGCNPEPVVPTARGRIRDTGHQAAGSNRRPGQTAPARTSKGQI